MSTIAELPGCTAYSESPTFVRGKPQTQSWTLNGVKVRVTRTENGSDCQASCQCLGFEGRLHSASSCPLRLRQCRTRR